MDMLLKYLLLAVCLQLSVSHSNTPPQSVIRVGHLLPKNPEVANEPDVLKMCAKDLKDRGILPPNLTLEIHTMESCNKYSGVENAAYLHYLRNATIYFGPGCNNEILVIGRLAPLWNVPIIAHMSGDDALADRSVYSTMGSVALTSATEMARATLTFIKLNGWNQIGIVRGSIDFEKLSVFSLKGILSHWKEEKVRVNVEVELDPYSSTEEILDSGVLSELVSNCRVIVCEMGLDVSATTNFMVAAMRAKMKSSEYVFVLPWLAHKVQYLPWEASNVNKDEVRAAFNEAILITAHGYDHKFVDSFKEKFFKRTGLTSSHYSSLVYMSLYDALFLYGLALRDAHKETGRDDVYLDGKRLWKKMTDRQFIGMTGQVLINSKALRVPNYATYFVSNGTTKIVVELEAKLATNCENQEMGCSSEHVAHEVVQNYWSSDSGQLPPDMPECGFDGGLCDYTAVYVLIAALTFIGILIPSGYFVYLKTMERRLYDMTWRIPRDDIRLVTGGSKSDLSRYTSTSGSFVGSESAHNIVTSFGIQQAICNGVRLAAKIFTQNRNLAFVKKELKLLKEGGEMLSIFPKMASA